MANRTHTHSDAHYSVTFPKIDRIFDSLLISLSIISIDRINCVLLLFFCMSKLKKREIFVHSCLKQLYIKSFHLLVTNNLTKRIKKNVIILKTHFQIIWRESKRKALNALDWSDRIGMDWYLFLIIFFYCVLLVQSKSNWMKIYRKKRLHTFISCLSRVTAFKFMGLFLFDCSSSYVICCNCDCFYG